MSEARHQSGCCRAHYVARTAALAGLLFTLGTATQAQERAFQFALIGDMPYTKVAEQEYQRVLAALNKADLSFVVHVGDFQDDPRGYYANPAIGLLPCLDDNYKAIYDSFQSVRHPFILTPGDNDWTDCHRVKEPKIDPLERLAKVRAMFRRDAVSASAPSRWKVRPRIRNTPNSARICAGQLAG